MDRIFEKIAKIWVAEEKKHCTPTFNLNPGKLWRPRLVFDTPMFYCFYQMKSAF
jgi:hypothetical protein